MTQNRPDTVEKPTAFKAFEPVLKRWTTAELEQASAEIADLVAHPGYRWLHRVVQEKKQVELDRLVYGGILSHPSYAAQVANVGGLDQVLHIAQSIQVMAERRDREELEAARRAVDQEDAA